MQALLENIKKLRILVIGDIMLDHYIWGDAERISPEAPVPVVAVDHDSYTVGAAANVALNVRSLGAEVELVGTIGQDASGKQVTHVLWKHDIALDPACTTLGAPTILKTRVIARQQQLCRLDRENKPSDYALPQAICELLEKKIATVQGVIVSDYAKGVVTSSLITRIREIAQPKGIFVAMDPKPKHKLDYSNLDLLTPNRNEALQLSGIEAMAHEPFPAEAVCHKIHQAYHSKNLVVTLGSSGMLVSRDGRVESHIPTYAREVFDVSGAGDTAIAALTLGLVAGATLEDAAHFANTAAGVVVGKVGTATATPQEILSYHQNFA